MTHPHPPGIQVEPERESTGAKPESLDDRFCAAAIKPVCAKYSES